MTVWDLSLKKDNKDIMVVELAIQDQILNIELDMIKMGIDWDGEFEQELIKDIYRVVDTLYSSHNRTIPTCGEIKELVEQHYYDMLDTNNTNDVIELNEIVYNELPVKNLKQLSYSIWQDDTCMENEEQANKCLEDLLDNLKRVYDFLDTLDEEDNTLTKTQQSYLENIDLYQIGDIINFIETIKIKKV